jgi:predicted phosphodiesterase
MPNWREHSTKVILTGSQKKVQDEKLRVGRVVEKLKMPLLIPSLILVVLLIASPMTFQVRQGELTYQMVRGSGAVEIPLGPAGGVELKTHKTPVNIRMELVLDKHITDNQTVSDVYENNYEEFISTAWRKFYEFLAIKILLLLLAGALIGFLHSGNGEDWVKKNSRSAGIGTLVMLVGIAGFSVVTLATYDKTPDEKRTGYVSDLPSKDEAIRVTKRFGGSYRIPSNMFRTYTDGIREVGIQRSRSYDDVYPSQTIKLFCVSDIHSNIRGVEIASGIMNGEPKPFDATILVGDITHLGTSEEADWIGSYFNPVKERISQILVVGGNHEDSGAMKQFQKLGYMLLAKEPVNIGGLKVMGADDPQSYNTYLASDQTKLEATSKLLAHNWSAQDPLPQVVVVHDLDQAKDVVELANSTKQRLTVVYGHSHEIDLQTEGMVTLVNCGTGGASGFEKQDKEPGKPYTYVALEFSNDSNPSLLAVVKVTYSDEDDQYITERKPID